MPNPLGLAKSHVRELDNLQITDTTPGPVLHDFAVLLKYVQEDTVELSKTGLLPTGDLGSLNAAMQRPLAVGLARPQLRSYPNIQGLYMILRSTGLVRAEYAGRKRFLRLDAKALATWEALNEVERYMCLLRLWLVWADCRVVDRESPETGPLALVYQTILREMPTWNAHRREDLMRRLGVRPLAGLRPGHLNVALAELFGLIAIKHEPLRQGEGWGIQSMKATPLGRAVLAVTKALMPELYEHCVLSEEEAQFALWQEGLAPHFPQLRRELELPEVEGVPGTYILRVSLRDVWRQLAVPSACDLATVANAILASFGFDRDHLYEFEIEDPYGVVLEYHHHYIDEPFWADETEVADLELQAGQEFLFRFDFGANWQFRIAVDRVDPVDPDLREVRQLAAHGEAPPQYT